MQGKRLFADRKADDAGFGFLRRENRRMLKQFCQWPAGEKSVRQHCHESCAAMRWDGWHYGEGTLGIEVCRYGIALVSALHAAWEQFRRVMTARDHFTYRLYSEAQIICFIKL